MESRGRILMADDEDTFLRATAALFHRAGYDCDCASDGPGAIAAAQRNAYDVLVTDINMTGNKDLELVREIRERFADLPVILVTGYPSLGTAIAALRLSAVDYLLKPVDFDELLGRVQEAIERARVTRSVAQHLRDLGGEIERLQSLHPRATCAAGKRAGVDRAAQSADEPASAASGTRAAATTVSDRIEERLSRREREILRAVSSGQRVASVARLLAISPHTVRNHLKAIFRKVGVHSQVELLGHLHAQATAEAREGSGATK
jgi:DNA-binding NarL/FixJ family response regulator